MQFARINHGFNTTFQPGQLSFGLVLPMESYPIDGHPTMEGHLEKVTLAELLGFKALWLRDIPFEVPNFGDVGQMYDPMVYLGALAMQTKTIALGIASLILPLRHPAHVAKAAASVDVLSNGRLLLGIASGDRPEEYPAMNIDFDNRGNLFRDSFDYIRSMAEDYPTSSSQFGTLSGMMNMLPKPTAARVPMFVTGGSRQNPDWVAEFADGWITYPRSGVGQAQAVADFRTRVEQFHAYSKPVMQSLYVDLLPDPDAPPMPIHLGFQSGSTYLRQYLNEVRAAGVNHVAFNLRLNGATIDKTLKRLSDEVLAHF